MNVNTILNIATPMSTPIAQGQSIESLLDFDALIGQAANPSAKNPGQKPDAAAPQGTMPFETRSASVVPATPVSLDIGLPASASDHFDTIDRNFKGGVVKQDPLPVKPATVAAEPNNSSPAKPIASPFTDKELNLRFAADMGKRSSINKPIVAEAENEKPKPSAKADAQLPKTAPDHATKPPIAPHEVIDTGHFDEETQSKLDAPISDLTLSMVQIAAPLAPPPTSTAAPVPAPVLPTPKGDSPKDIKKTMPLVDKEVGKILLTAAELPTKMQSPESMVTQFSMPTPAPLVTTTTTMAAPLFAVSDRFATQQLDLALDSQWIEQLTREIVSVAGQDGKLRFGLAPDGLGQLEVMVETQQDGVNIQFQTSTENAAKIIAAEQPKLLEELRQSGVRVTNGDLMAGHQMQGQRDQSRNPNPAWQSPSSQPNRHTPSSNPNTSHSGRFA
jgi:flagellar hook-length control protein FliK